jgi:hypothetical protein
MGTSKNALMSPTPGGERYPTTGFWHSVVPERLI